MTNPTLAIIVGSNRRDSINRKLAGGIAKLAVDRFEVTFVQIDDLPMYNQDHEDPLPAPVARFKGEIKAADALLFVTPEHNRSVPAVLKNAIDWGTRPYGQNVWDGKLAMVTGTSQGAVGTALAQQHLRSMLTSILGAVVVGTEAYIQFKPELIDAGGKIANEDTAKFLQGFIDKLAVLTGKLATAKLRAA